MVKAMLRKGLPVLSLLVGMVCRHRLCWSKNEPTETDTASTWGGGIEFQLPTSYCGWTMWHINGANTKLDGIVCAGGQQNDDTKRLELFFALLFLLGSVFYQIASARSTIAAERKKMTQKGRRSVRQKNLNDGYSWPSIFDEADEMLDVALLTYVYAELRKHARKNPGSYRGGDTFLNDQDVTANEVVQYIQLNQEQLRKDRQGETIDMHALESILQRQEKAQKVPAKDASVVVFDDKDENSELVFGIAVDHVRQRVIVSFRGSVTLQDWIQDAQLMMEKLDNPYRRLHTDQPTKINLHNGFHDYLFQDDDGNRTKYENIIRQLKDVLKKNPNYKLYVTGHSLGAALSSLFTFVASADERIPKPVTCVSFASPLVGDENFRRAFQLAESLGRIRYLRVSNHKDIVSILPSLSFPRFKPYKHVGMNLKLFENGTYDICYAKSGGDIYDCLWRMWSGSIFNNLGKHYLTYHSPKLYDTRLDKAAQELKDVQLNDLYSNTEVVGNL